MKLFSIIWVWSRQMDCGEGCIHISLTLADYSQNWDHGLLLCISNQNAIMHQIDGLGIDYIARFIGWWVSMSSEPRLIMVKPGIEVELSWGCVHPLKCVLVARLSKKGQTPVVPKFYYVWCVLQPLFKLASCLGCWRHRSTHLSNLMACHGHDDAITL